MASVTSFRLLEEATTRLYEAGRYQDALDLIDEHRDRFEVTGHQCRIAFYRSCLLARLGAPAAALDVLDAGVAAGLWWSTAMLADADLDPCRGERLDRIAARATPRAEPLLHSDEVADPVGVLFALHGGGAFVDAPERQWSSAVEHGWTVHQPLSSQRVGAGIAAWSDLDVAVDECRRHLATVGPIDAIAGFSLGSSLALRLATEARRVPILMLAPSLRPEVVQAAADHVSGLVILIVQDQDDPFMARTIAAVPILRKAGADVAVTVVPGLGHEIPDDLRGFLAGFANPG